MQLVSTVTVGAGGAASITFTGIPQTGTDLLLVFSGRGSISADALSYGVTLNNDSGTSQYVERWLRGTGSSVASVATTGVGYFLAGYVGGTSTTSNTFSNDSLYLPNYTSALAKSVSMDSVYENNGTLAYQAINAGRYAGTSAITRIDINGLGYNFVQHSTASLYTITRA